MNLPNALTITRIFLVPLLVVVLLTKFEGQALLGIPTPIVGAAIFGLASVTDWLDGYLARRRGQVTSLGRMIRLSALELPTLPPTNGSPNLSGGAPLAAYVDLPAGEEPLTIVSLGADGAGVALGTAQGVVKRVTTDYPGRTDFELISLKDGDQVEIGRAHV